MRAGRVLHTGQGLVDLVLRIPTLPQPGGDTFASSHEFTAGGGVNVMAAAARDGAHVVYAGAHGTGPFGDIVRAALDRDGIDIIAPATAELDTGFSIALVDDSAERTFVSTTGAEGVQQVEWLRAAAPEAGDVVYVSGYSLVHAPNREALLAWLPTVPPGCTVVVDPSPVIGEVDLGDVHALIAQSDVWSTNEREAVLLLSRLGAVRSAVEALPLTQLASQLADALQCDVVLRAGAAGAVISRLGVAAQPVPALRVEAVDSNGAGDAHTGVMCARLALGETLDDAVRRAGVAAALAVTRHGPATAPTAEEIDVALADLVG